MKRFLWFGVVFACGIAEGQGVVEIRPANPTSGTLIEVDVVKPVDLYDRSVAVVGNRVDITFSGYSTLSTFSRETVPIGPLPVGNYEIVVTFIYENEQGNPVTVQTLPAVSLAVIAGGVPAIGPHGIAVLAAALALAGIVVLKRW